MESTVNATTRSGGLLSVLTGIAYFAVAVCAALLPAELSADPDITPHGFWTILAGDPAAHLAMHWAFVAVGLFGVGVVVPVARLLDGTGSGLLHYVSALAFLGFAVNARSHLMELAFDRKVLPDYADADPAYQQAVHVAAALALDIPDGVLTLGGIGVWMAVASLLLVRARRISRPVAASGLAAALLFAAGIAGYVLLAQWLIVASFVGGFLVLAPLWHIAVGRTMLRG